MNYQPERTKLENLGDGVAAGPALLAAGADRRGSSSGSCIWRAFKQSPRLIAQMFVYMGMYLHFCQVHGKSIDWSPWQPAEDNTPKAPPPKAPAPKAPQRREPAAVGS